MSFPPPFTTPRLSFIPIDADQHAASVFETRGDAEVMKYSINHAPDRTIQDTHAWLSRWNRFDHSQVQTQTQAQSQPPNPPLDHISSIGYVIQEIHPSDTTIPKDKERIIGTTGLRLGTSPVLGRPPSEKRWEIGYGFHTCAWGRGLATETVAGLIRMVGREGLLDGFSGSAFTSENREGNGKENGETKEPALKEVRIKKVLAACTDARNDASRHVLEKCGFVLTGEFLDAQGRENFEFEYVF